jgi:hypothetical protein
MQPQALQPGTLTIHATYPAIAFMLGLFKPVVTIDGQPVKVEWKNATLALTPGIHDVRIHVAYLWPIGRAQLTVDNRSGAPVEIYYASPYIAFSNGAIGYQPVEAPDRTIGLVIFWGAIGLLVLILLCGCIVPALSALSSSST